MHANGSLRRCAWWSPKRSSPESGAPCGPPRGSGPTSVRAAHHHSVPRIGRRSVRAEVPCKVRTEFRNSSTAVGPPAQSAQGARRTVNSKVQVSLRIKHAQKALLIRISRWPYTWPHIRVMKGINQPLYSGFYKTEYEHIRVIAGVYMAERNRVIANIPVRRGLEEGYWVHVNVANVQNT